MGQSKEPYPIKAAQDPGRSYLAVPRLENQAAGNPKRSTNACRAERQHCLQVQRQNGI